MDRKLQESLLPLFFNPWRGHQQMVRGKQKHMDRLLEEHQAPLWLGVIDLMQSLLEQFIVVQLFFPKQCGHTRGSYSK